MDILGIATRLERATEDRHRPGIGVRETRIEYQCAPA